MEIGEFTTRVAKLIAGNRKIIVFTGAGISTESGIPDFRGPDGLWKKFRAEELANFDAFTRNPELVWEWYQYRRSLIYDISPNPGHFALAQMENKFQDFNLITQNVDGLHRRAGSEKILEVHGDLWATKCISCDYHGRLDAPAEGIPLCPECKSMIRPDVVWFGESLDRRIMTRVHEELASADVILVVGTSALVQPAASFPLVVKHTGGKIIETNIERTPLTPASDVHITGKAGEVLPLLDQLL